MKYSAQRGIKMEFDYGDVCIIGIFVICGCIMAADMMLVYKNETRKEIRILQLSTKF